MTESGTKTRARIRSAGERGLFLALRKTAVIDACKPRGNVL